MEGVSCKKGFEGEEVRGEEVVQGKGEACMEEKRNTQIF